MDVNKILQNYKTTLNPDNISNVIYDYKLVLGQNEAEATKLFSECIDIAIKNDHTTLIHQIIIKSSKLFNATDENIGYKVLNDNLMLKLLSMQWSEFNEEDLKSILNYAINSDVYQIIKSFVSYIYSSGKSLNSSKMIFKNLSKYGTYIWKSSSKGRSNLNASKYYIAEVDNLFESKKLTKPVKYTPSGWYYAVLKDLKWQIKKKEKRG